MLSVGRGDARATVMTAAIYTPVIAPAAAAATTAAPGADSAGAGARARARDGLPETIHTATDPPESVQGEFKDIIDAACF